MNWYIHPFNKYFLNTQIPNTVLRAGDSKEIGLDYVFKTFRKEKHGSKLKNIVLSAKMQIWIKNYMRSNANSLNKTR